MTSSLVTSSTKLDFFRFVRKEKLKLNEDWKSCEIEKMKLMKKIEEEEDKMKELMIGEQRLMNDLNLMKKLNETMCELNETSERFRFSNHLLSDLQFN